MRLHTVKVMYVYTITYVWYNYHETHGQTHVIVYICVNCVEVMIISNLPDNIFVFCDAWKQSGAQPSSISGSLETRFEWSWLRAMKAMFVTSLTTCSAFVLTSLSDVPIIASFGTFAAMVFIWVYILAITFFPCMVCTFVYMYGYM